MKKKYIAQLPLFYISIFGLFHSSQASENTIEGFWFASGAIIEIKVCEELICAEVIHVITDEGVDPSTVLDENNDNEELRDRPLIGINMFDGFSKELISNQSLEGGRIYDPRRGKFYSSELSLLENGNLLVEGCLLFICDGEEWFPLEVTINSDGSRQATFKNPPEV